MSDFDPDKYLAEPVAAGFDPDAYLAQPFEPASRPVPKTSTSESVLAGAGQGITMNWGDELAAGVGAGIDVAKAGLGLRGDIDFDDAYQSYLPHMRAMDKKAQTDNPWAYGGANLAGTVASAAVVPGLNAAKYASTAGRAAAAGVTGGVFGAGSSEGDLFGTEKERNQFLTDTGLGTVLGAGTQLGIDKVITPAAKAVAPYIKKAATKAMSVVGGVSDEAINKYLANPNAIRGAKSLEEIKDVVDDSIARVRFDVDEGKLSVEHAQKAITTLSGKLDEAFSNTRLKISGVADDAKDALKRAYDGEIDRLTSMRPPEQLAGQIAEDMGALRKSVSQGSGEAFDILSGDPSISLRTQDLKAALSTYQNQLKVAGAVPTGPAGEAFNRVNMLREWLDTVPAKELGGAELKEVVQMVDGINRGIYRDLGSGSHVAKADRALMSFRGYIDDALKANPDYAAKMAEVAPSTQLLAKLRDAGLSDEQSIAAALRRTSTDSGKQSLGLLDELGATNGKTYAKELEDYLAARQTLGSRVARDDLRKGLPEFRQLGRAQEALEKFDPSKTSKASELMVSMSNPTRELQAAEQSLAQAQGAAEPFRGWSQATTENRLNNIMRNMSNGKGIEYKRTLEQLSANTGLDFKSMLDDRRVADAFEKGFMNGSRNVNLWAWIGHAVGAVPGGAAIGGMIDKAGPKMTQHALDAFMAVKDSQWAATLSNAAEKSPTALAITSQILTKKDPDYRRFMENMKRESEDRDAESKKERLSGVDVSDIAFTEPEKLGKYAPLFQEAQQKGANAVAVQHHVLWSKDPEYRKMFLPK